jgi:hypothetical protein
MSFAFNDSYLSIQVNRLVDFTIKIDGKIINPDQYSQMELIAPNPIDRGFSLEGSGLPFANPEMAFEGTLNKYVIPKNGLISDLIFSYPNGYYVIGGSNKIPPSLFVILYPHNPNEQPHHIRLELLDDLPVQTLTYRPNHTKGPAYYGVREYLIEMQGAEGTYRTYSEYKQLYDIA